MSNATSDLLDDGNVALQGDHFDIYGNYLGTARVVLRIINGCVAVVTVTQTIIQPSVGALAMTGNSPVLS